MFSEPNVSCKLWVEFAHAHTHSNTFQHVHVFTVCPCVRVGHGDNDVFEDFAIPEEDEEGPEDQKSGGSMFYTLCSRSHVIPKSFQIYNELVDMFLLIQPSLCVLCVCVLVCVCAYFQRRSRRNRPEDLWHPALLVGHRSGHGGRSNAVAQPVDQTVQRHVYCSVQWALPHPTQDRAGTHNTDHLSYTYTHTLAHLYRNFACFLPPCSITQQQTPHMSRCPRTVRVPQWRAVWMKLLQKT